MDRLLAIDPRYCFEVARKQEPDDIVPVGFERHLRVVGEAARDLLVRFKIPSKMDVLSMLKQHRIPIGIDTLKVLEKVVDADPEHAWGLKFRSFGWARKRKGLDGAFSFDWIRSKLLH